MSWWPDAGQSISPIIYDIKSIKYGLLESWPPPHVSTTREGVCASLQKYHLENRSPDTESYRLISLIYSLKRYSPDFGSWANLYYCQSEVTAEYFGVWNGQGAPRWGTSVLTGPEQRLVVGATYRQPNIRVQLLGDKRAIQITPSSTVTLKATVSDDGRPLAANRVEITLTEAKTGAQNTDGQFGSATPDTGLTNEEGELSIQYTPAEGAQGKTVAITASCSGCKETSTWDVKVGANIVIGFFNGVSNTDEAAQKSLDRLEVEFGPVYKDTPLKYAQFYNQTACDGGFCLEDMAETFEQRSLALNGLFADRWETFWDILASRHQQDNSLTGRLFNLLGNGSNALLQWLDTTATAVLNQLVNNTLRLLTLFSNSPTSVDRADHMERLWRYADDGTHMLLVAHSQGNLFVNSAYDALMKYKPEAKAQVVHVAPAALTLRGEHVLADIDLVINALRGTGLNSVPDVNINLPLSKIDPSGHSFEPTYLDKARAAYARTIGMITASLDALTP